GKANRAHRNRDQINGGARREVRLCPMLRSLPQGRRIRDNRRACWLSASMEQHMAFKNFKVETDPDGIALVTWNIPGRSMNVLDETTIAELETIVKQTSADNAIKGVVVTSGKEAFSRGADLSMLEAMNRRYAYLLKDKGEVAANQMLFDES